jgi:hypothetical protein
MPGGTLIALAANEIVMTGPIDRSLFAGGAVQAALSPRWLADLASGDLALVGTHTAGFDRNDLNAERCDLLCPALR